MNEKSSTIPDKPTTSISRQQLTNWFRLQGGKEYAPTTKPLDTPEHIKKRMIWVIEWFELLVNETSPVTYLDEKWFHTTNRRRKIKRLPKIAGEEEIKDLPQPKVRSRRFPIKTIFVGVVGQPLPEKQFDDRVHLERVSEKKEIKNLTAYQNFATTYY